jgi:hypothetical protein
MRYSFNWKVFLSGVTLIGPALMSATASAAMTPLPTSDNPTTGVVTIGVMVTGTARPGYVPLGNVVFTEGNNTLGVAGLGCISPFTGEAQCEVRLSVPGLPLGSHTITASYSGDQPHGGNPPESFTFRVYVSEFAWLPAMLELLSQ